MTASPPPGLDLREDEAFQRAMGRFQRVGFAGLLMFLAAGLLGLCGGGGPLSRLDQTIDGVRLSADRVVRFDTAAEFVVVAPVSAAEPVRITLNTRFLDSVRLDSVMPPPQGVAAGPAGIIFTFAPPAEGTSFRAVFAFTPEQPGRLPLIVRVNGAPELAQTLVTLP